MDITRLRTLTLKSKAFFYSDPNWTVEKLIKEKSYVVMKAYYEQEKLSFNQEVLDILKEKYPRFIEIDKPSRLVGWNNIVFVETYENMPYDKLVKIHRYKMAKYGKSSHILINEMRRKKSDDNRKKFVSKLEISKRDLQGKNHGR